MDNDINLGTNKKRNTIILIAVIVGIIAFLMATFFLKWYRKSGFWFFVFGLILFIVIFVILYFKPYEPERKSLTNAEILKRVETLLMDTDSGTGLRWGGGAGNKMISREFKRDNGWERHWAIQAKSKEDRFFIVYYDEKNDTISIDGAPSTELLQNPFATYKPFKSDDDVLRRLMMNNMYSRRRRPSNRLKINTMPGGGTSVEQFGGDGDDEDFGRSE